MGWVLVAALAAPAHAGVPLSGPSYLFPAVPVSAFARPAAWLDPSRLSLSGSMSFGSYGGGLQNLNLLHLRYALPQPWGLQVSVGSLSGWQAAGRDRFFLEGVDLTYRPSTTSWLRLQYRDYRSPLQISSPLQSQRPWGY